MMVRRGLIVLTTTLLVFLASLAPAYALSPAVDLSYDKCYGSRTASWIKHYESGIVGVNGGGDWEKNPCLASEIKHFDNYALYVNTNYPSAECHAAPSRHAAYDCGYNLGLWDVRYASSQEAYSRLWFIDVESGPGIPWSSSHRLNAVFLYGLAKGLESRNIVVGWYSTPALWSGIAGNWHPGGYVWYATGSHGKPSKSTIREACSSKFTGPSGFNYMYQYIDDGLDRNIRC